MTEKPKVTVTYVPGPIYVRTDSNTFTCARCDRETDTLTYRHRYAEDDNGRRTGYDRTRGPWCEACVKETDE